MKKEIRKKVVVLFLLLTVVTGFSQDLMYGDLIFNQAVNISGKQRMLTQKMAKVYLFLLDNSEDFKAKKDLKITKLLFEKQLVILKKNTSNNLTLTKIKDVEDTWAKYKGFLDSSPNKKDAVKIINMNTTMLNYTNNVVAAIISESKDDNYANDFHLIKESEGLKRTIDKAGKQRMLSQRLALYYFASKPMLKTKASKDKLQSVFLEIDNAFNDLLISSFNTDRVDEALGEVMFFWEDVKKNNSRFLTQGYKDSEVYKLSNDLTKGFNKITNLYQKLRLK